MLRILEEDEMDFDLLLDFLMTAIFLLFDTYLYKILMIFDNRYQFQLLVTMNYASFYTEIPNIVCLSND